MSDSIDDYIRGLRYDPRELLRMEENGSTEALPPRNKTISGNAVIICTNTNRSLNKDLSDVAILSPTTGVVFPGALVRANQRLAEGKPDPIALRRSPITLRIDLPGLADNGTKVIENPTNSSVQAGVDEVLECWNADAVSRGYVNKARSYLSITKAYSSQQLALELGFSTKWTAGDVAAQISASSKQESSVTVAFYKQVFYTVIFDSPPHPSSVFAPQVELDQIKNVVGSDDPPAYVRSVDYGRIVMIKMETASSETKTSLEGALNQVVSGGAQIGAEVNAKYTQIIQNSTFTVVALGGNPDAAATISQPKDLEKLNELIRSGATYSRSNPGAPISYTVAFLQDNQIATLAFTTNYTEKECVQYTNGYIQLEHAGAYVAKFNLSWEEQDEAGEISTARWESGKKTAGYSYQVELPGDATNIKIRAEAATGLVWDPWGQIFSCTEKGPTNLIYKASGTTLDRRWEKIDPRANN
jgi:thiol-activated cytolysin